MKPPAVAPLLSDRYAIERELGRGGMATVYLAHDRKHGRRVAVKVLRAELAASVGAERFLREIRIAASLAHPHILPLIDSGETDGFLYYVTPHVPDGSLRERLEQAKDGRLPLAEALRIAREVGTALDFAHRQGFVHRDVKPENILFADAHAVLADFGIARACGAVQTEVVTESGFALGTPEYMSPEQASGDADLGGPSDLYSLACVVYEMLTGKPPIQGAGARSTMSKQVTETPQPVRTRRPDVPPEVERALARALAKNPDERFATVAEFLSALEGSGPAGGAVFASAAARCIAVLPFVNASPDPDNEYLSDGITDELIDALAKVEGLRVPARSSVFALKGKPQDARAVGALLGAAWVLEGTVRRAGERLRVTTQLSSTADGRVLWSQRYDRTFQDVLAIQEEIARTIVDTLRVSLDDLAAPARRRYTQNATAYTLYLKGRYAWNKRTSEGVLEAIDYFQQAIAADPAYAPGYAGLADAYALQLDYRSVPVADGFAHAKEYARKALALDETLAEAHASLAWSLFIHDWDWEGAAREFRRSIELDPRYATAQQWYAFSLAARERHDEALVAVHTALELDPASVSIRRAVGWIYYYARRAEQARYHLAKAIAMNPTAAETYRVLALTYVEERRWEEAERVVREALALPAAGAYSLATLGYVQARAGNRDGAESVLQDLEARAGRGYVSPVAFSTVYLGLDDHARALDWLERAYAERRGWLAYLRANPLFDRVRSESRFLALLDKMRLTS